MKKILASLTSILLVVSCNKINPETTLEPEQKSEINREIVSKFLGDSPNFAQTANGNLSAVVSRSYGRGAKAGALVELFYPNYTKDHLWDAYNGIFYDGKLNWFHDTDLVKQEVIEDSGIITSEFKTKDNKLSMKTSDLVIKDNDTLVRHLEIKNNSSETIKDLKTFFYEFITVNYVGSGDTLEYDKENGYLVHKGSGTVFIIASEKTPEQWQCGGAENLVPLAKSYDARKDAEDGNLKNNESSKAGIGLGVNGSLGHNVKELKAGETFEMTYYISAGKDFYSAQSNFNKAKNTSWNDIKKNDLTYWKNWLAKAKKPNVSKDINKVYRRALITMKQNTANSGAIIAAPVLLTPVYAFTWPRDGCISAQAYMEAGYTQEAKNFLDFIIKQQKPNGGWAVNFFMDGSKPLWDFGDLKNEHDQVGTVIWAINDYYKKTKDINWLRDKWDAVKRASEFLIRYTTDKNLMTSCRDLWELHTDKSWTFTNAAVVAGLRSASEIASVLGNNDLKLKYSTHSEKIKQAIYDNLWDENGKYYIRGMNTENNEKDLSVEAANLGLSYPFNVFPANDPRIVSTADKIYKDLKSGQNGIKRYTGDQYYDGQPWPATTDWLAIYLAKSGRKSQAEQLHQSITNYAYTTGSLMLGEQFDENKKIWVSSLPLTWSEAKYVLATLEIYK
ncbi:MAG: glycoside hydrolase family 15 protein [Candidatus Sericytochromatia bacterium]